MVTTSPARLTKELKLTFAKAEHLKRNAAKSPDMASILKAIKPVLTDFVGEVQRSLGYFTNTHRDAHVAHLVGLGSAFKLPGLQKYLADKLSLEVKKPTRFEKLSGDTVLSDPLFQENLLTFPIAYGLALQGLGQARLTTNLLPKEIIQDRLIRSKKPYAAASAAAAAHRTGCYGTGVLRSGVRGQAMDKSIDKGIESAKAAGTKFDKMNTDFTAQLGNSKKKQDEVKLMIAGQEERLNWPRWVEVFTAALPRPGADGNLNLTKSDPAVNSAIPPFSQVELWKGEGTAGTRTRQVVQAAGCRRACRSRRALAGRSSSDHPKSLAMESNVEVVHSQVE